MTVIAYDSYFREGVIHLTIRKVSPKAFYERLQNEEKIFLLDVRAEEKYLQHHIENEHVESLNLPKDNIFNIHDVYGFQGVPITVVGNREE